ncbi:hypothetical protein SAMN04487866_10529 [Thermoactinomyces sp. DSM 45891]|uniref:iron chaperone n=1 Tax=Thermoactinomyces sp. DSM 45891 TaxID=1761907 RepID=UPI00091AB465|nr:iron chaperone [Thermoactinomyces sp. DSM 45891]SFX33720.1 hypothetical protein SAMN04487866_10529 [Thermoactinomyces sp. DSM 45891]
METFADYLATIENQQNQARLEEVLDWVIERFPNLVPRIAWNQPMFTDHGTFIIGFSVAKHHFSFSPEKVVIDRFSDEIKRAGYEHTKQLVRIRWDDPIDFSLLEKIIEYNIVDKADCSAFWRK